MPSETSKHRNLFLQYCTADKNGIDIGAGGDPIIPSAITIDRPFNQAQVGNHQQNIKCDAKDLFMFKDNSLDYAFSSHCIEDFEDTRIVLIEWLRVLKPGGYLCLLFPDEKRYREVGTCLNADHKHLNMGLIYMVDILKDLNIKILKCGNKFENNDYNCYIIAQKGI